MSRPGPGDESWRPINPNSPDDGPEPCQTRTMNATRLSGTAPSLRYQSNTSTAAAPWRNPNHVVVETCVENVEGVRLSARAGADRAELCDNLAAGGTTPSIGTVEAAIFAAAEEVAHRRAVAGTHWARTPAGAPFGLRIMIRPRGGSYVFDADEIRIMTADVRRIAGLARQMSEFTRPQRIGGPGWSLPQAVDLGFVVGALTEEHVIDRGLLRLLIDLAEGAPVSFNKAIDVTRDPIEAYGDLGGLGVDYVLTSGGADSALEGTDVLRGMVETGRDNGGPKVIAAGQITPDSIEPVVEASGVREIHLRCSVPGATWQEPQRTEEAQVRRAVEVARSLT